MAIVGVLHFDRGGLQQVLQRFIAHAQSPPALVCSKVAWSRRNAKMGCVTLDG
ncbi:hypothetical protein QEG98_22895 [Myxococcus sp. MxC21-1]|uniref:hypothetical protein n=1 Tax=Myxococcus sp. MxC21-1 TaxID=3041439 RepID=UPI002930BC64|nr:hypothetical protein [Myxococcus sp. MxC21-1]WNZ58973.1 hypothetical protein QEG98_22895 [Myxococcus sp. MxC21-1]